MKSFALSLTAVAVVFGLFHHAPAHAEEPSAESDQWTIFGTKADYAASLQPKSRFSLLLHGAANVADMVLACPLDAAEIAATAVAESTPLVAGLWDVILGTGYATVDEHDRLVSQGWKIKRDSLSSIDPFLSELYARRKVAGAKDGDMSVPLYLGAILSPVPNLVAVGVHNAATGMLDRNPDYVHLKGLGRTWGASYMMTEAQFILSFQNEFGHCRGSARKIGQIADEFALRKHEDARGAKNVAAGDEASRPPQLSSPSAGASGAAQAAIQ